jgi:asparagine synthase (glutamine-hydrolysing)
MPSDVGRILAGPVGAPPSVLDESEPLPEDALHHTLAVELRAYTRNQLLRDSDAFGMANSQEIRVPLLDHLLAEEAFRAPAGIVTEVGLKGLLRDALPQPLPRICTHRPKMGFTFPFDAWMRGPWRAEFGQLLATPKGTSMPLLRCDAVRQEWQRFLSGDSPWYRSWALASLISWERMQADSTSSALGFGRSID